MIDCSIFRSSKAIYITTSSKYEYIFKRYMKELGYYDGDTDGIVLNNFMDYEMDICFEMNGESLKQIQFVQWLLEKRVEDVNHLEHCNKIEYIKSEKDN